MNSTYRFKVTGIGMSLLFSSILAESAQASGSATAPRHTDAIEIPVGSSSSTQANSYTLGKAIYLNRISCDSCPLPSGVDSPESAHTLIGRIDAGEFGLSRPDKRRLKYFLKRRFEIK